MVYFCKNCVIYFNFKYNEKSKIRVKETVCFLCLSEPMQKIYSQDVHFNVNRNNFSQYPLICDLGSYDIIYLIY
jgi:hypothetical protein